MTVGVIVAPHGVRGEVRVRPETDFPERFAQMRTACLVQGEQVTRVEIASARPHGDAVLMRLGGVTDRTGAEALRGASLAISRDEVMPLPPDQYYLFDLVGLRVRTQDGRALGTVAAVMRGPAHDVYVVRDGSHEVLLPAIRQVIRRIDLQAGEMTVTLPAGLEG
ncbi:MAG: 16S rRNA processing protein RimM [Armatimonadetes bacterium]|nr:16S rRNA processing protein RimM [Armatimonadota bacterium]